MVEHLFCKQGVAGSSPFAGSHASIAQLEEHRFRKPEAVGSIPTGGLYGLGCCVGQGSEAFTLVDTGSIPVQVILLALRLGSTHHAGVSLHSEIARRLGAPPDYTVGNLRVWGSGLRHIQRPDDLIRRGWVSTGMGGLFFTHWACAGCSTFAAIQCTPNPANYANPEKAKEILAYLSCCDRPMAYHGIERSPVAW